MTSDVVNSVKKPNGLEASVVVNPLDFCDWDKQLANHRDASFFHSLPWATVLRETYNHAPLYFCRFEHGNLKQLLPAMEIDSPFTGRRGVSLPFADSCSPLSVGDGDLAPLYEAAILEGYARKWRHFECRGSFPKWPNAVPSIRFFGHTLRLDDAEENLFRRFSSAVRRGIRKSSHAGVQIEFGSTVESMRDFCALHAKTRRRHGLPVQPKAFFDNIARYVLGPGHGFVAVARYQKQPIAAAMFFSYRNSAIFKFGASDYAFQSLRPNNLLMWQAFKKLMNEGKRVIDFGRTSIRNLGLRRYKLGWGTEERQINYFKYDLEKRVFLTERDNAFGWHTSVFRGLPASFSRLAGVALYRHFS